MTANGTDPLQRPQEQDMSSAQTLIASITCWHDLSQSSCRRIWMKRITGFLTDPVTNLAGDRQSAHHRMSLSYIHITLTVSPHPGLHSPSAIALITCVQSETLFKPRTSVLLSPICKWIRSPLVYSATQGSSNFSSGHRPGMDTTRQLLALEQGTRSLEGYIQEYLALAYYSDLPDCMLKDFFCEGINQPLKSRLLREGPRSSLAAFMDYALLCVGSSFTVGVADEEHLMCSRTEGWATTCAPTLMEPANHSMEMEKRQIAISSSSERDKDTLPKDTPYSEFKSHRGKTQQKHPGRQQQINLHSESPACKGQTITDLHKSSQAIADHREPSQAPADLYELSQVTAGRSETSHGPSVRPGSSHVPSDRPESSHVPSDRPESSHASSVCPESGHVLSDRLQPCHVSSDTPRSRPVMMASVLDPPLVSVRAANISVAPAPTNPIIKEVLPPAAALPLMAVAIWCVWAAHCAPKVTSVHKSTPEVTSVHKSAPEVTSVRESTPEVLSDLKSAPEVPSDLKSAPEVPSDLKSAPEVSSAHKSATEVSSAHKSATEVSSAHKSATEVSSVPEISSVLQSAPEVSSDHKSAPEVSSDHEWGYVTNLAGAQPSFG
ncbi:Foot protein 1 variant 1 [Labeo rohita]|uniref:Foot protein 1 variant 1 n=1 Tax=Labeo rohita TaxID=84645 RepID=A0ABQ8N0M7_LABRO|nr:Foot protein 1 variant 1 [Labeo rohita]